MECPECEYNVPEPLLLCPRCGAHVEETQPMKRRRARRLRPARALPWVSAHEDTIPLIIGAEEEETPARLTLWQRVRVVLLSLGAFLCLLTLALAISGYLGLQAGQHARAERRLALADEHYRQGLARLDSGEYELALAEFEYALQLVPDHPLAKQGVAEARARLASRPTPTSPATEEVARELYNQAQAAYEREDWPTAARLLNQLRAFAPDYESETVEEMLFTSLYQAGMMALAGDSPEEGIFYLDQAQRIRTLDADALRELELARRYLKALGYWGVDWETSIRQLEALYALAPNYRDLFQRLYQARLAYGNLWAQRGEMCPAAEQYTQALRLMNNDALVAKRDEAAAVCAVATPTPIAPITGTLPGAATVPGFTSGRLAYAAYNTETGMYDLYTLLSDGANGYLSRIAQGADQPSWRWSGGRLIYRDRRAPGITLLQPDGSRVLLRAGADAAWPTLSPDGTRYAYAAPDGAGVWHIYIARTDGTGTPIAVAPGWGPSWGPTGLIAWTGCEADGSACGIYVDHPDDPQPPVRLTGSAHDTGLHWAPGGDQLLYMSDHTGNWDLYLLGVGGGVQVLLSTAAIEGLPAWSPDGSTIAFLSYRDNTWGLYLMQPDGGHLRPLLRLGAEMPNWPNQRLSWAP